MYLFPLPTLFRLSSLLPISLNKYKKTQLHVFKILYKCSHANITHRNYYSLLRQTCNQIAGMREFNYNSITIGKEIKLYIFYEKFTQKKS